jgi:hypothetical protein
MGTGWRGSEPHGNPSVLPTDVCCQPSFHAGPRCLHKVLLPHRRLWVSPLALHMELHMERRIVGSSRRLGLTHTFWCRLTASWRNNALRVLVFASLGHVTSERISLKRKKR